eukprot:351280-Chlamydomonas_euryale.AAC.11
MSDLGSLSHLTHTIPTIPHPTAGSQPTAPFPSPVRLPCSIMGSMLKSTRTSNVPSSGRSPARPSTPAAPAVAAAADAACASDTARPLPPPETPSAAAVAADVAASDDPPAAGARTCVRRCTSSNVMHAV